jgi:SAM-dependent methyltransferase
MDKQYYNEYYQLERKHWWFRARMEILETLLIKHVKSSFKKELKILNVGVATGATSIMLEKHGNVTSLEYDRDCCDFLRETVGIDAVNASLTELPFENDSYDVICGFDVIEHIENDNLAVSEIYRVLKKGGFVYLTVPAFQSLWSSHDIVNHHFRRYRMKDFSQLIKNQNFEIVRKTYFNFILFLPVYVFRVISKLIKKEKREETAGSDFDHFSGKDSLNSVFYRIFRIEKALLKNKINFPFGISALLIAKK